MLTSFCGLAVVPIAAASAAPCPAVEVVFARGTNESAGVGSIGQGFVDSLQAQAGGQSVSTYAVQYPATIDFPRAVEGVDDAGAHIQATAADCPDTRIVLGGFSQGAAVAAFTTAAVVPQDYAGREPLPAEIADHVAAVVLFGKPSPRFLSVIDAPDIAIGPLYADKVIDMCATGDPVCSGGSEGSAHGSYVANGMASQAASFAVARL
ncbi:MAG: cutinase family protein [Mycobacterium sp.]